MLYIIIVLAAVCFGLSVILIKICWQIKEINKVLDDIQSGNMDRRLVISRQSFLADTCYKINEIMMKNIERVIDAERNNLRNDRLMTCLSHDIRTPLTSIIGYLDAIHYQFIHGENSVEFVETAREKAYILKQYIDDLFQWFKIHSKDERAELESIDIVEGARAVYANWIEELENHHIFYELTTDKDELYAIADKVFLERVLNNLIKNALVHSGGTRIWIEISDEEKYVSIKVKDNGKGISADDIPYIFDRLYKNDTSRNQTGSGLGLAITRELVLLQKGKISVQSVQNQGTAFVVELPKELD